MIKLLKIRKLNEKFKKVKKPLAKAFYFISPILKKIVKELTVKRSLPPVFSSILLKIRAIFKTFAFKFLKIVIKLGEKVKKANKAYKKVALLVLGILIVVTPVLFIFRALNKTEAAWFDDNFSYRQKVAIANSGSAQTDYQIPISLDTASLISTGKMKADCGDVRVTDYNGKELPIWIETGTNACGTGTTQIWTKVPSLPTPSNTLLLYYGNPSATGKSDGSKVFEFFDDFSNSNVDTNKWTAVGGPTISGGVAALTNGQTLVSNATVSSSAGLGRIISRVKQNATNQTGGKLGFYNINDAATLGFGNFEEKLTQIAPSNLVSHHKLEETTSTDANQFKASGYLDTGKLSQAVSMYGHSTSASGPGSMLTFNRGIQISGNNYEHFNGNQGSISFWFKATSVTTSCSDPAKRYFSSNSPMTNPKIEVLHQCGTIYFLVTESNSTQHYVQGSNAVISAGTWYHVVGLWNASNAINSTDYVDFFLNGSRVTSAANNAADKSDISWTAFAPGNTLSIGGRTPDGAYSAQALIDDMAVFDRVLSSTEISTLYNSGTGREAGSVADPSLKFYAKMDGSGTLAPVTYNGGASASKITAKSTELTGGTNLLADGNMEAVGVTNWTASANTTASKVTAGVLYDTQSLKVNTDISDGGSGNHFAAQTLTLSANSNYYFSAWYNGANTGNDIIIRIFDGVANIYCASAGFSYFRDTSASTWKQFECAFKTGSNTSFTVRLWSPTDTVGSYGLFDNVTLTPSLVDNGGMEGAYATCAHGTGNCASGWDGTAGGTYDETATAHSGSKAMSAAGTNASMFTTVSITNDNYYLVSLWARSASGTANFSSYIVNCTGDLGNKTATTTYQKWTYICKANATGVRNIPVYPQSPSTVYFDDISVIPLDNTALSFQAWTPTNDTVSNNPLSVHGDSDGVVSTTSSPLNNAYTFDGSTGYLRQKTYDVNVGTLTYADSNTDISDTSQEFEDWDNDAGGGAEYMIVVTNSDNTTSWGYFCADDGGTQTAVYTTKSCTGGSQGFNGTSPSGKTPVGYEVRKTDYQITGDLTFGAWVNVGAFNGRDIMGKFFTSSYGTYSNSFKLTQGGTNQFYFSGTNNGTSNNFQIIGSTGKSINTWYFVVGVINGSTATLYINGVSDGSVGGVSAVTDNYGHFTVAKDGSVETRFFQGSIDSPFVLNTALTSDQIAALYQYHSLATTNNSTISVINGSATPTNDTNYHTYVLTTGSSNATVSSDNTTFATSSGNLTNEVMNLRMQNNDSTNALSIDWIAVAKQASTAPSVANPTGEEKGGGPVAYWKFDDGTGDNAQDSTSNNNDGSLGVSTAAPSWQSEDQCISGKCLYFDGSNDYVSVPSNSSFNFDYNQNFSVSIWVKIPATQAGIASVARRIMDFPGSVGYPYTLWIRSETHASSGKLLVARYDGTQNPYIESNNTYNDNKWHYIVFSKNGSTLSLYVDGQIEKTSTDTTVSSTLSDNNLYFGSTTGSANFFHGFIDEPKIYNYARTSAQVKADYNAGKNRVSTNKGTSVSIGGNSDNTGPLSDGLVGYWKMDESSGTTITDSSGNNHTMNFDLTFPPSRVPGKFGSSIQYDGVNTLATVTNTTALNITGNNITLAGWVYLTAYPSTYGVIFQKSGYTQGYRLMIGSTGKVFSDMDYNSKKITSTGIVPLNSWTHVAVTYDGNMSTMSAYINGSLSGTSVATGSLVSDTTNIKFGKTEYMPLTGSVDEVRIYNRTLSPSEMQQLYNYAPAPVGYWNFEDIQGNNVPDHSGNDNSGTISGTNTLVSGYYGKGLSTGTNAYIGTNINLSSFKQGTYSLWVKNLDISDSNYGYLFQASSGSACNAGIPLVRDTTNMRYTVSMNTPPYNAYASTANNSLVLNQWQFLTVSWDATQVSIYLNGVLQAYDNTIDLSDISAWGLVRLGGGYCSSANTEKEVIDNITLYNYVRTSKQIIEDMNANHPAGGSPVGSQVAYWKFDEGYGSFAKDSSINNLNGTLTNSPTWNNNGKFGKAISFAASGDEYITAADNAAISFTGDFSLSFWINPVSLSSNQWIFRKLDSGDCVSTNGWGLSYRSANAFMLLNGTTGCGITSDALGIQAGQWNHIVVTVSNTNVYFYRNGVLKSTKTGYTAPTDGTSALRIGSKSSDTEDYNGLLDEVKFYNYALSSAEVKLDYNHGSELSLGTLSDKSTYSKQAANQEYCVPGDTTSCNAPVGEWKFEEHANSTAYDTSLNAANGSLGGGTSSKMPKWVPGKFGTGLSFDGADDYVNIPDASQFNFSGASATISVWFKTDGTATQDNPELIHRFQGGASSGGWHLYQNLSNKKIGFSHQGTTNHIGFNSTNPYTDNKWHQVSVVIDNSTTTAYLYLDGVLNASDTYDTLINFSKDLEVGGRIGTGYAYKGSLDNLKIFNYARTPAQIAWDYNQGDPVAHWKFDECRGTTVYDSSGNLNNGAITIGSGTGTGHVDSVGTCSTTSTAWGNGASGKYNSSMSFDSIDDYITVTSSNFNYAGSSDFSVSAWVKPTVLDGIARRILSEASDANNGYLLVTNAALVGQPYFVVTKAGTQYLAFSNTIMTTGNWYHLVGVFNNASNTITIYVNGISKTGGTGSGFGLPSDFNKLYIGNTDPSQARNWGGQIDDVRIYNYGLTPTQTKLIYNQGASVRFGPSSGTP